ncbi:ATP-binding cassette domain-containing protein [Aestuariibacter halophilus]|uniref:ATP-binding cassette domain-containing protein n=1 Tax=Fluctibacter halophilus TaxID=226011 RepID=A0ABS8G8K4_9ALTE|nr:ATP-binding cassette domain-containing protein [Aestuariibacter halophilus]MCC2616789.1 ATP-binding cassette domain-containing protein [Aestuariibacter halophilus]
MPVLQANNISYQFANGDMLFQQVSCTMAANRVGLVGRNGVGKSTLAALLSGEKQPSQGAVMRPPSLSVYRQQPRQLLSDKRSIGAFLGVENVLVALKQVERGDCAPHWFDVIGEQWDLPMQLTQQLTELGLPADLDFPCAQLSGGQLARLQLWQLFQREAHLLILDEPSNHLDTAGKQWLIASMQAFNGAILLVSHDRALLREMDEIWELSGLGLSQYGGNYDAYARHKQTELDAMARKLVSVEKQKRKLQVQAQRNREKAEQRAAQGKKRRNDGSQPKVLTDSMKDRATARASQRVKGERRRQTDLQRTRQALKAQTEQLKSQTLYLQNSAGRGHRVASVLEGVMCFGNAQPVTLHVHGDDKIHLIGNNGCGKSTLLKTLLGELRLKRGELQVSKPLYYLEQHFGTVRPTLSVLENLLQQCDGLNEIDARTVLAGIGFRGDSVYRLGEMLSGGEKMKLAMLIVGHQPQQPFLLLDEPDNHLDLDAKHVLARTLSAYRGGFIVISHDHDFANDAGVNRHYIMQ